MKILFTLCLLGFISTANAEWKPATLDLGYGSYTSNLFNYENTYNLTIERCTRKNLCLGFSNRTTTSSTLPTESFNKFYVKKRWVLK